MTLKRDRDFIELFWKWLWAMITRKAFFSSYYFLTTMTLRRDRDFIELFWKRLWALITSKTFLTSFSPLWLWKEIEISWSSFENDFGHWSQAKCFSPVSNHCDFENRYFIQSFWKWLWALITSKTFLTSFSLVSHHYDFEKR